MASFNIAIANVGDAIILDDGRTIIIEGVQISSVLGNAVLVGNTWIDVSHVVTTAG